MILFFSYFPRIWIKMWLFTTSAKSGSSLKACWLSSQLFLLMLALVKTWFGNAADVREENKSQLMYSWLCGLSTVLCIHTVFDAVANSPEQQNGHIAKMNINHGNLTLSYLYTKYSKLNKIILIMKLWWINMGIWQKFCLNACGDQYKVDTKMLTWNRCVKGLVVCFCAPFGERMWAVLQ